MKRPQYSKVKDDNVNKDNEKRKHIDVEKGTRKNQRPSFKTETENKQKQR